MKTYPCPQCGNDTRKDCFDQGVCASCAYENQIALDKHNTEYDAWQRTTDGQREDAIRRAV